LFFHNQAREVTKDKEGETAKKQKEVFRPDLFQGGREIGDSV